MNRINRLEEMLDAGVRSFKIEGRLKDIGYVKNVTAAYRQAIDAILKRRPEFVRSSFGTSTYTFQPDLSRSFSRGNTEYFLDGRTLDLASPDTPKSKGREVGRVKEVRRDCIIVSSSEVFSNGDGLCFFDEDGRLQGFRVNKADGNKLYLVKSEKLKVKNDSKQSANERNSDSSLFTFHSSLKKGDRLWRSFDQQWERQMSGQTAVRRIPAHFLLEETEEGFRLYFEAEDGTQHSETFPAEHQPARTDQAASIKEVLSKLGDTPYVCTDVKINFSQPWFIPRSTLADWRRKVAPSQPPQREASFSTYTMMQACSSPSGETEGGQLLMTCRFCLRHAWGQCLKERKKLKVKSEKLNTANCKSPNDKWQEPLFLVLGDGRRFRLHFDCKKCEMSVFSAFPL